MPILCPTIEGTGFSAMAVGGLMHAGGIRMDYASRSSSTALFREGRFRSRSADPSKASGLSGPSTL